MCVCAGLMVNWVGKPAQPISSSVMAQGPARAETGKPACLGTDLLVFGSEPSQDGLAGAGVLYLLYFFAFSLNWVAPNIFQYPLVDTKNLLTKPNSHISAHFLLSTAVSSIKLIST